jgi:hypothetical protein
MALLGELFFIVAVVCLFTNACRGVGWMVIRLTLVGCCPLGLFTLPLKRLMRNLQHGVWAGTRTAVDCEPLSVYKNQVYMHKVRRSSSFSLDSISSFGSGTLMPGGLEAWCSALSAQRTLNIPRSAVYALLSS